jgi:hypothetical protein
MVMALTIKVERQRPLLAFGLASVELSTDLGGRLELDMNDKCADNKAGDGSELWH